MADNGYVDSDSFSMEFGDYGTLFFDVGIKSIEYISEGVEVVAEMKKTNDNLGGTQFKFELYVDGSKEDSYESEDGVHEKEVTLSGEGSIGSEVKVEFEEYYEDNEIELSGTVPNPIEVSYIEGSSKEPGLYEDWSFNIGLKNTSDVELDGQKVSISISGPSSSSYDGNMHITSIGPGEEKKLILTYSDVIDVLGIDRQEGEYKICFGG